MSEIAYPVRAVGAFVADPDGRDVAICWIGGADVARRIAACLNACRDISTDNLENVGAMSAEARNA